MTTDKKKQLKRDAAAVRRRDIEKAKRPFAHKMSMHELAAFTTRLREGSFRDGSAYTGQREG